MKTIITKDISKAVSAIRKGGIVIYPTETSYGIGCDFTNRKALNKIYRIKKRIKAKKLPVIVSSVAMAKRYAVIKNDELLSKKNTTFIFPSFHNDTIALRISSNKIARSLARRLKKPVVATSANISGENPVFNIEEIKRIFNGKVDVILDYGKLPKRKLTKIIDIAGGKVVRK